jgi:hypothetical protein
MATELEIYNMALADLGIEPVSSLTGTEKRHDAYKIYYLSSLEKCLEDIAPRFAIKRESLSLLSDITVFGFDYAYQLPGDCLSVRKIFNESDITDDTEDTTEYDYNVFRIGDESKTVIATSAENAVCEFLSRVRETTLYSVPFKEALRYKIAENCANYLTGDLSLMANYNSLYGTAVVLAKIDVSKEKRQTLPDYTGFTESR